MKNYYRKGTKQIQKVFYFFFFRTFAPIFHFKLCSFCWRERKNISCPGRRVP